MKKLSKKFLNRGFYLFVIIFSLLVTVTLRTNAADSEYVIIVNKQNPVSVGEIKMSHIRNVFLLNKTKWRGGKRAKPIFPEASNPSYDYLLKNVLKMGNGKLNRHWLQIKQRTGTSPPSALSSDAAMVKAVSNTVGGIAIVKSSAKLPSNVKVVVNLK